MRTPLSLICLILILSTVASFLVNDLRQKKNDLKILQVLMTDSLIYRDLEMGARVYQSAIIEVCSQTSAQSRLPRAAQEFSIAIASLLTPIAGREISEESFFVPGVDLSQVGTDLWTSHRNFDSLLESHINMMVPLRKYLSNQDFTEIKKALEEFKYAMQGAENGRSRKFHYKVEFPDTIMTVEVVAKKIDGQVEWVDEFHRNNYFERLVQLSSENPQSKRFDAARRKLKTALDRKGFVELYSDQYDLSRASPAEISMVYKQLRQMESEIIYSFIQLTRL